MRLPRGANPHSQPAVRILVPDIDMNAGLPDLASAIPRRGPYALEDAIAYRRWREQKLAEYPRRAEELVVDVRDPCNLDAVELERIRDVCRRANMAIYRSARAGVADRNIVLRLGAQLGLTRRVTNPLSDADGITALEVVPHKMARGYLPYSQHRMLWHTDGYYNDASKRIRAFILHCVRPAPAGGANRLLDPEIAYIRLRDANPDFVRALMAADAMTIPANTEQGYETRPAQTGPVFAVDAGDGSLHMRYTARTRSIVWRADAATQAAVAAIGQLLAGESPWIFTYRLRGGEGLICNNVLHDRSAFTDDANAAAPRLLYRARYCDRVAAAAGERASERGVAA